MCVYEWYVVYSKSKLEHLVLEQEQKKGGKTCEPSIFC